ncbi:MAG: TMEM175 family protein [Rhizonema sp. PD38]|nr:TMEM175 family protein [Rhizonema sp. PD38]
MTKGRLEAFSDGVIAIIITIMVLEMKVPHGADLAALRPLIPVFLSYILSYIYIGIYWNNHHHLLQAARHINGRILWANLHLLFWLSLVPFATGWMGDNHFAATPVALYGIVLFFAGLAYFILSRVLVAHHGLDSTIATAIGKDFKGKVSLLFYALAILLSYVNSWLASSLYILVAIMWFIPDRRIERNLIP